MLWKNAWIIFAGIQFMLGMSNGKSARSATEQEAADYILSVEPRYSKACNDQMTARWAYITNVTDGNAATSTKADTEYLKFQSDIQAEILEKFSNWKEFTDAKLKREFQYLSIRGPATTPSADVANRNELLSSMEKSYATATVCEYKNPAKCDLHLEDIEEKLSSLTDYDELAYYYTEWHNAMNKAVKPSNYTQFVSYEAKIAEANGFNDMSEMWMASYNDETQNWNTKEFKQEMLSIWDELKPFYNKLHAYVRMKLRANANYTSKIKRYGYLPANLLGNMWGQDWAALDKTTKPYPNAPSLDATEAMVKKEYTPVKIFEIADQFFTDMGLIPLSKTFWDKSMLERPSDREVVCHPSAEDFCLGKGSKDFRIKQCTKVNMDHLVTAHHEAGHIQYFLQYTDLDFIFRDGANPGFHEAIGDCLALAVTTPKHLQCVLGLDMGLNIDCSSATTYQAGEVTETDINYLYITALQKFVFFPFAISMDSWRWEVFEGKLKEDRYNERWWELRQKNQGISPPSPRPNDAFDPAAKYHIVANVEYLRYFISHILQFQFYEAMCIASGEFTPGDINSKPLYQCDFSGSKAAGKLLSDMMKLGFSKGWPEALKAITGSPKMSTSSLVNYFRPLFDLLDKELVAAGESACFGSDCEPIAQDYLDNTYEQAASNLSTRVALAEWAYKTDLNNAEAEAAVETVNLEEANFEKKEWKDHISQFDFQTFSDSSSIKRRLNMLNAIGTAALSEAEIIKYNKVTSEMTKVYGTGKVCPYNKQDCDIKTEGLSLNPDLERILANGTNYDELAYIWKGWRDASGKKIRELYYEYIDLSNKAAVANGYKDAGEYWRRRYESKTFSADLENLWNELKPLYEELHAYVRYKLSLKFPQVKVTEPLPANVLGNMWSQSWDNIYQDVVPYPNATSFDITHVLQQKFTPDLEGTTKMFDVANVFFLSLGLSDMQMSYGPKGMIVKPTDREVVCHASAWDFSDGKDFRIKMCTRINQDNFITVHHELGHIQYYLNYKNLPITFRGGSNPGFHEAIGDVVSLSVGTPKHMAAIGFIESAETNPESTLNYLMQMALDKVAFLPFGYLIDSYRWRVFDGTIPRENLTYYWLKMRNEYQGIIPPFIRTEEDFDAGSKYHVPGSTPYIRYFVSYILQFQIHKALCIEAGEYPKNPLHECDIYKNRAAGSKFKHILEAGASKNWQDLLQEITGTNKLDASAIKEYFAPLSKYLEEKRRVLDYPIGWTKNSFEKLFE